MIINNRCYISIPFVAFTDARQLPRGRTSDNASAPMMMNGQLFIIKKLMPERSSNKIRTADRIA